MTKDINRTKYDEGDTHGRGDIQLSSRSWNKMVAKDYDPSTEQPKPEEMLIREAIKYLTPIQRKVWECFAYDKLTQDEIAKKLGKKRTTIQTQIAQCEKRIARWCKSNMGAYELLKSDFERME